MESENKLVITEIIKEQSIEYIDSPCFDGFHLNKIREYMSGDSDQDTANHILSNAYQGVSYFKNPKSTNYKSPSKILCLGKVQSGKTSFFLAETALAFDNGYDVAYILGGTKIKLKNQNFDRVTNTFSNNDKIKIFNVDNKFDEDVSQLVKLGYKVILVILKNAAENTNLGKLKEFSEIYKDIPSFIIDDEGDEYSPGAERSKRRNNRTGKTHDKIVDIINSFEICTFLTVTATPQANLLISTYDGISPNRLVLVKPGKGYTGGHEFFDTKDNLHVKVINDNDDFIDAIPDSFKNALFFFIYACCLKRSIGDLKPLSMLVHPSSFNRIQNEVAERIHNYLRSSISCAQNEKSIQYDDVLTELENIHGDFIKINPSVNADFNHIVNELKSVLNNLKIQVVNYKNTYEKTSETALYTINVGGNMLGRGLTIDRLIVSYIYRDSKESQVDTMYQRCRWFGYKMKYFDVCRVYMTSELQNKFMAIVSNEDHMWNSMESFLDSQIDLKKFKRIFLLENDKLILTRKSVSNTISLKVFSSGNQADECIDLTEEEKENNRRIYKMYLNKHEKEGSLIDFDNSNCHNQQHLVIKTNFIDFYNEFLSKIIFSYGSPFNISVFNVLIDRIHHGLFPNEILIMFMRYGKGEYRSPVDDLNLSISRLFQGRNDGTRFTGDRYPIDMNGVDYSKNVFIQVHMVDIYNKTPKIETSIPLISFNQPLTSKIIKMVTGDNHYEE